MLINVFQILTGRRHFVFNFETNKLLFVDSTRIRQENIEEGAIAFGI